MCAVLVWHRVQEPYGQLARKLIFLGVLVVPLALVLQDFVVGIFCAGAIAMLFIVIQWADEQIDPGAAKGHGYKAFFHVCRWVVFGMAVGLLGWLANPWKGELGADEFTSARLTDESTTVLEPWVALFGTPLRGAMAGLLLGLGVGLLTAWAKPLNRVFLWALFGMVLGGTLSWFGSLMSKVGMDVRTRNSRPASGLFETPYGGASVGLLLGFLIGAMQVLLRHRAARQLPGPTAERGGSRGA
jgi:hypothetical protein